MIMAHDGASAERQHEHYNPSPSQAVGAWCNGHPGELGCGKFVPLYEFKGGAYMEPYFVDGRSLCICDSLDDGAGFRAWREDGTKIHAPECPLSQAADDSRAEREPDTQGTVGGSHPTAGPALSGSPSATWPCDTCGRQVDKSYGWCPTCSPEKAHLRMCPACDGDGRIDVGNDMPADCERCKGTGEIPRLTADEPSAAPVGKGSDALRLRSCSDGMFHGAHVYEHNGERFRCPGRRLIKGNGYNTFDAPSAPVYPAEEILRGPGPASGPLAADETSADEHFGRIVAWVRFDGDEYHHYRYQTAAPKPSEVERMRAEGWLPLVVQAAVDVSDAKADALRKASHVLRPFERTVAACLEIAENGCEIDAKLAAAALDDWREAMREALAADVTSAARETLPHERGEYD